MSTHRNAKRTLQVALFSTTLLTATVLPIFTDLPRILASTDTYPTSISGCRAVSGSPSGYFTCDPKDDVKDTDVDPWGEYNRECVSYVAWMLHSVNGFEMPFNDNADSVQ